MIILKYKGIPVELHYSFYVLVAFLILPELFIGNLTSAMFIGLMVLGLFGSVVMHEFGHALMARRFGIETRSIVLFPFGGVALLTQEPPSNKSEFYIALAGPATNIILCLLLLPLAGVGVPFCHELIGINLVLGIFNLLPAFPMDGGRVLRAFLAGRMSKRSATRWSLIISKVFASLFMVGGLLFGYFDLAFIGAVLFFFIWIENKRLQNRS